MNPPDYTPYNRLAFVLPATSVADAGLAVHERLSYSCPQGPYPRTPYPQTPYGRYPPELVQSSVRVFENFSYHLPLVRGFDVSHLRQGSSEVGSVPPMLSVREVPRGRPLRRLAPSIGRPSPQAEASSSFDLMVDTRPSLPPPYSPTTEFGEYQRPVFIQPSDIHAQFGIGSSRLRSPFTCRRPFSSPPPIPPRSAPLYLANRRRSRQTAHHEHQRNRSATNGGLSTLTLSADEVSIDQVQAMPEPMWSHCGSYLPLEDVPKKERKCGICYEEYASNGEAPFRLAKCGHLFGNKCIGRWFEEERKKTCPMCRCIAVSDRELYKY